MPDREKVIHAVETAFELWIDEYTGCSWFKEDDVRQAKEDAIALLKEQEAKTVESIQMDRSDKWGADLTGYCPSCKRPLKSRFNKRFCGECGQAVKWE